MNKHRLQRKSKKIQGRGFFFNVISAVGPALKEKALSFLHDQLNSSVLEDNTDYHYDDDIESFEYREGRHENSDNSMENATYNFFIQDTKANILYSNGYVQQKLRIVNDNGTAIAEDNVALS
ncbi:uncharacterized protein TNCV_1449691 [Trichonephila clavipes]|nr:uncharacterized protein TNCV_1449691 [Trichonephila clavipes]